MKRAISFGFALLLLVGTAGCADDDDALSSDGVSSDGVWGPLAVIDADDTNSSLARGGAGVLTISDRCVTLSLNEAPREITLVWRSSQASWDDDRSRIRFEDPNDGFVDLISGAKIEIGGEGTLDDVPRDPQWLVEPDNSCPNELFTVHDLTLLES